MASIIKVETLQDTDGNNAVGMQYVSNGSAKSLSSWANSADTNAFPDANNLNVSSGADVAVGKWTITYTNNFSAVAKQNFGTSFHITTVDMAVYGVISRATSSDQYEAVDATGPTDSQVDHARNMIAVFGDLA